ncbi:MAG TPA: hypothetical protein VGN90_10145 [Pyrinomonadaceae bacterium]|jgi:hypothetical protein|nr:hypothetical protein [Pyrinomonadaceae bacterium]
MKTRPTVQAILFLIICCIPGVVFAQAECDSPNRPRNLTDYLEERICVNLMGRVDQTDPTKQAAPPATAENSTSLVERSSAPDLLGFGLDLLNLSDVNGEKESATPKTMTFSAYALKSAFSAQDPLDPEIYNKNAKWRSLSFTVGYDVPENTDDRDPIIGFKWLALNGRDLAKQKNQNELSTIQSKLNSATGTFSATSAKVKRRLFAWVKVGGTLPEGVTAENSASLKEFEKEVLFKGEVFENLLSSLSEDQKKEIDDIVATDISDFAVLEETTRNAVQAIRSRPQLALVFTTTQRKHGRPDEYNGVLTFDKGMGNNSITLNGSFIFKNNPVGQDSRGGQFAAAFHVPLNTLKPFGYKDPWLLSIEADATGMTGTAPVYKAQAKLTIPLLPGMEIPLSVSVANRAEFVNEKEVKGKFGFTFDVSKIMKAFRDNFLELP